jgi:siroheme synthase
MADKPELTSKALEIIQEADIYLNNRQAGKDAAELARIQEWLTALRESATMLTSGVVVIDLGHEPGYKMLSEQLDLTRQHIQELQEWYPYSNVDLVYRTLHHQLQTLAGPQGPGAGPHFAGAGTHGPGGGPH